MQLHPSPAFATMVMMIYSLMVNGPGNVEEGDIRQITKPRP